MWISAKEQGLRGDEGLAGDEELQAALASWPLSASAVLRFGEGLLVRNPAFFSFLCS